MSVLAVIRIPRARTRCEKSAALLGSRSTPANGRGSDQVDAMVSLEEVFRGSARFPVPIAVEHYDPVADVGLSTKHVVDRDHVLLIKSGDYAAH